MRIFEDLSRMRKEGVTTGLTSPQGSSHKSIDENMCIETHRDYEQTILKSH